MSDLRAKNKGYCGYLIIFGQKITLSLETLYDNMTILQKLNHVKNYVFRKN